MRKLVSVKTINKITPIPEADRIESAQIDGWNVVVGKDQHHVGEKVAFFEIDSFLREDNPIFEQFQSRGQKTMEFEGVELRGHVLKTMRLRGVWSQGLIMSLESLGFTVDEVTELSEGLDITEKAGVLKWEEQIPLSAEIIGNFDTRHCPKTDAIRLQNLTKNWDLIKDVEWVPTLKVDGTSQTFANFEGNIRVFGRNWELDSESSIGLKIAGEIGLINALKEMGDTAVIQAELVGPNIQSNSLKLPGKRLIVFAVWKNGVLLNRNEWPKAALANATPILGEEFLPKNFETPEELIEFVNGIKGNLTKNVKDEGIVYHPMNSCNIPFELARNLQRNLNFKVISNSWLLKNS